MDVRCERCKTEYELDDAKVTETGVPVKCTTCGYLFRVKKKALVVTVPLRPGEAGEGAATLPPSQTGAARDVEKPREWRIRRARGGMVTLKELTTLQRWIVERKVTRDDEISLTGETWKRLGEITELAAFFQIVDAAQGVQSAPAVQPATVPVPAAPPSSGQVPSPVVASVPDAGARGTSTRNTSPGTQTGKATGPEHLAGPLFPQGISPFDDNYGAPSDTPRTDVPRTPVPAPRPTPNPVADEPTDPGGRRAAVQYAPGHLGPDELGNPSLSAANLFEDLGGSVTREAPRFTPSSVEQSPEPSFGSGGGGESEDDEDGDGPADPDAMPDFGGGRRRVLWLVLGGAVVAVAAALYLDPWKNGKPEAILETLGPSSVPELDAGASVASRPPLRKTPPTTADQPALGNVRVNLPRDAGTAHPPERPEPAAVADVKPELPSPLPSPPQALPDPAPPVNPAPPPTVPETQPEARAPLAPRPEARPDTRPEGRPDGRVAARTERRSESGGSEPVRDYGHYISLGDRLRERDHPEQAMNAYGKAVDLEPDRAEGYAGRGLALLDLGQKPQAEASFQQALKLNARYGVALMGLAETYRALGRNAEAIRNYEKYLEVAPNGSDAIAARTAIQKLRE